jgi:hypothetical protein
MVELVKSKEKERDNAETQRALRFRGEEDLMAGELRRKAARHLISSRQTVGGRYNYSGSVVASAVVGVAGGGTTTVGMADGVSAVVAAVEAGVVPLP